MACTQGHTSFQPTTQWTQDLDNHILRVCLPGFQKDEFKVQVDNCGKLTVRGGRTLSDGKYMRLEQVFDVPKDSQIDKIRGKFEDARLFLFMPKKVEAAAAPPQRPVSCEKKKTVEPPLPSPPAAAAKVCDKKEEAQTQKDEPKTGKKETPQAQAAAVTPPGPAEEQKPRSSLVSGDQIEEYKKKAIALKVRIEEEVEGWLDQGLMDGLLETISRNKKAIAIAAAAFTVGFYISRKLRSSG